MRTGLLEQTRHRSVDSVPTIRHTSGDGAIILGMPNDLEQKGVNSRLTITFANVHKQSKA